MIAVSAMQRERREETPSRQVTFSQPCDMLHEPSLLWMQPWMPPTLIHTLVTSWITGSHVTWQAAWNSPVPVRSPSCTYVLQATTGPAATFCISSLLLSAQGTMTSSNQKSGILRGVVLLAEMSGGLQKHNEITKFLSNIFS